jgi:hypothetical protein
MNLKLCDQALNLSFKHETSILQFFLYREKVDFGANFGLKFD